ncbi:MAG: apolipoprotein N-acyltransferase [Ignavibacteria bacterium]|nr:apolipoprotein N-acyltransferase [Ignavibacteria bacterium]
MSSILRAPFVRAALSGTLLGLAFPQVLPFGLAGVLSFLGFVPLLLAIIDDGRATRSWKIVAWFYLTFVIYHGLTNWWVCSWQERTDPYLFASGIALWLFHPFFLMLPFVALASIRRRLGTGWMLFMAPLSIAGFEWLHGQTDASYPWLTTGYSLIHTPFAQIADTVGVYGLSFLIASVNVVIVYLTLQRVVGRTVVYQAVALCLVLASWLGIGVWKAADLVGAASDVRVMIIQPNEDPWDKWGDTRAQVRMHQQLTDSMRNSGVVADVVVWSETSIPYTIRDPLFMPEWDVLQQWVDTSSISLLAGYADIMIYAPGQAPPSARQSRVDPSVRFDAFNAAMMINAGKSDVPVHRKSMLTPFAERLPFADQLTFAMSWIEWGVGISAWGKGQTRLPLPVVKGSDTLARIGTIICIESIYPEVARDLVNNGSDILCVITNDAWYNGTWGPEQHYDIARMRAIEQRRNVIRCANSGVSGIIRSDGSEDPHPAIAPMTQGAVMVAAQRSGDRTLYAVLGDPMPILGLILTLLAVVSARIPLILRNLPFRFTSIENTSL